MPEQNLYDQFFRFIFLRSNVIPDTILDRDLPFYSVNFLFKSRGRFFPEAGKPGKLPGSPEALGRPWTALTADDSDRYTKSSRLNTGEPR